MPQITFRWLPHKVTGAISIQVAVQKQPHLKYYSVTACRRYGLPPHSYELSLTVYICTIICKHSSSINLVARVLVDQANTTNQVQFYCSSKCLLFWVYQLLLESLACFLYSNHSVLGCPSRYPTPYTTQ